MTRPGRWLRFRLVGVGAVFGLIAIVLAHRAYSLQVKSAERLRDLAEDNYLREIQIPPGRGRILDRNGKEFAVTVEVNSVFGNPRVLAHVPGAADKLARALGVDRELVRRRLASRKYFAWLKRRVTPDEEAAVRALEMPGIHFRPEPRRFYPLRSTGATVIGYAGSSGKGLAGLELAFDDLLLGSSTSLHSIRDALGREILIHGLIDTSASAGHDVRLTLDSYLSMVAQNALQKAVDTHGARAATAVVMDPRTGHVLAMASVPSFNPNRPGTDLQEGARNRAITDAFEPGSTMKTFTFAAVLDRGKLRPTDLFDCEKGRMKVGRYTIRDTHPLEVATAEEIYRQSSNICTVKIARRISKQELYDTLKAFGFGERSGLRLPGERKGIIWPIKRWGDIGFANVAFGQGLTATPLQITAGFAAVAARGIYRPPRVAWKVIRPDGSEAVIEPKSEREEARRVMSEEAARTLLEIMAGVPTREGTARKAAIPGYRIAGKTGTAQKVYNGVYDKTKWLASFVGLLPVDDPEVVIGVFVDEPWPDHLGGLVAAPVFREIAEAAVKYLNIPPSDPLLAAEAATPEAARGPAPAPIQEGPGSDVYVLSDEEFFPIDPDLPDEEQVQMVTVPDVAGMTMVQAMQAARQAGLRLVPEGSGVAHTQEPTPLRQVVAGARLWVSFRPGG